jgi:hypothetical protein
MPPVAAQLISPNRRYGLPASIQQWWQYCFKKMSQNDRLNSSETSNVAETIHRDVKRLIASKNLSLCESIHMEFWYIKRFEEMHDAALRGEKLKHSGRWQSQRKGRLYERLDNDWNTPMGICPDSEDREVRNKRNGKGKAKAKSAKKPRTKKEEAKARRNTYGGGSKKASSGSKRRKKK